MRSRCALVLVPGLVFCCGLAAFGQAANPEGVTVIRAGTLIDGISNAPRRDQVIVVRGNRIERNNIGARFQDRFAVSPAAASRIQHQGASARHQQRNRLAHEHRAMINEFFPILCFLLEHVWSAGEPNRTFKEQSTHLSYNPMTLATCW